MKSRPSNLRYVQQDAKRPKPIIRSYVRAVQFFLFAREIISASESKVDKIVSALVGLSVDATSYAKQGGETAWPFVTIPDWEIRTNQVRTTAGLDQIIMAPIVKPADRAGWGPYSAVNQGWIDAGLYIQGRESSVPDQGIIPIIYPINQALEYEEFSIPLWQVGPAPDIPTLINHDLLTNTVSLQAMARNVIRKKSTRLSPVASFAPFYDQLYSWYDDDLFEEYDDHLARLERRTQSFETFSSQNKPPENPSSSIVHPVYADFESDEVVAIVMTTIAWERFFEGTLPKGVKGFIVYVENDCGIGFTYEINGGDAELKGPGDLHDRQYDYLGVSSKFAVSVTSEECQYTINVYPTRKFEAVYETSNPAIYTSVVVLVFFFTAMVFILYDYLVTRRQSLVMNAAAKTQALVSSLFPKSVQQRILEDANDQAIAEQKNKKIPVFRGKTQLKEFLEDGDADMEVDADDTMFKSRPIADLFPETTVLFADIAGFTAWSSTREPSQVFTLLETIYHSFDEIAKRRRVFKVETVGGMYRSLT